MGDFDQRRGALADGLTPKLGNSILGDDVMHVAAAGHDARSALPRADDSTLAALSGSRGQRNERVSSRAARGAADEIDLPADPRKEATAYRVRSDLSGEVDGQR